MTTSITLASLVNRYDFKLGGRPWDDIDASAQGVQANTNIASELLFENHFTSSWKEGPHIQFRQREVQGGIECTR